MTDRMRHDCVEVNSRRYEIYLNGVLRFRMSRESVQPFFWLLERSDGTQVDRDQYQNDLFERIDLGLYEDRYFDLSTKPIPSPSSVSETDNEIHHRCFHCSAYMDECQCDGGLGR